MRTSLGESVSGFFRQILSTRGLVTQYPRAIQHYPNEHFGQPAFPRNFGISKSVGEFIICLDADDKLHPEYIEICMRALRQNPAASIAYTEAQSFGSVSGLFHEIQEYRFDNLLIGSYIPCASLYKKVVWKEVGGYKADLSGIEDWNFWIEAGKLGHFGVPIGQPLYYHRARPDGLYNTVVLPNELAKRYPLILHNSDVYDAEIVRKAALFQLSDCGDAENGHAGGMNHVAFLAL